MWIFKKKGTTKAWAVKYISYQKMHTIIWLPLKLRQHCQQTEDWNEKLLIKNRMGNQFMADDKISPFHG